MHRLRRVRPRVYEVSPRPSWCVAVLRVGDLEVVAKRIGDGLVSIDSFIGLEADAEVVKVIR